VTIDECRLNGHLTIEYEASGERTSGERATGERTSEATSSKAGRHRLPYQLKNARRTGRKRQDDSGWVVRPKCTCAFPYDSVRTGTIWCVFVRFGTFRHVLARFGVNRQRRPAASVRAALVTVRIVQLCQAHTVGFAVLMAEQLSDGGPCTVLLRWIGSIAVLASAVVLLPAGTRCCIGSEVVSCRHDPVAPCCRQGRNSDADVSAGLSRFCCRGHADVDGVGSENGRSSSPVVACGCYGRATMATLPAPAAKLDKPFARSGLVFGDLLWPRLVGRLPQADQQSQPVHFCLASTVLRC